MADDTRYAYAVARVRGLETRLLDHQWIERLLGESAEGAVKVLSDSAYQAAFADVERPEDIESGLERAMAETLDVLAAIAPEPELIDVFRIRWDVRNAKALLKASLLGVENERIGVVDGIGTLELGDMRSAIADRDYAMLPEYLTEALRDAEQAYRDRGELVAIDEVLDRALWERTLSVARQSSQAFLVGFFRAEIDLSNLRTFVRMKDAGAERAELLRALIPGGRLDAAFFEGLLGEPFDALARRLEYGPYPSLAEVLRDWSPERTAQLELLCDDALLAEVESARTTAYGIEPLVAYLVARMLEIKLIRAAVTAKLAGLERPAIESRMRKIHV